MLGVIRRTGCRCTSGSAPREGLRIRPYQFGRRPADRTPWRPSRNHREWTIVSAPRFKRLTKRGRAAGNCQRARHRRSAGGFQRHRFTALHWPPAGPGVPWATLSDRAGRTSSTQLRRLGPRLRSHLLPHAPPCVRTLRVLPSRQCTDVLRLTLARPSYPERPAHGLRRCGPRRRPPHERRFRI